MENMVQLRFFEGTLTPAVVCPQACLGLGARSRRSMQRLSQDKNDWYGCAPFAMRLSHRSQLIVLGVVFGPVAYYAKDLPKSGEIIRRTGFSTKIYDRNGKLLDDVFADEK